MCEQASMNISNLQSTNITTGNLFFFLCRFMRLLKTEHEQRSESERGTGTVFVTITGSNETIGGPVAWGTKLLGPQFEGKMPN